MTSKALRTFSLGEFFCGPGGLAYGAINAYSETANQRLQIEHAWANDIDPSSCETYQHNIVHNMEHHDSVYCCDVWNLDFSQLSPIDIFAYGFPCNDFSIVGEHKGINGDYGGLYYSGVKLINQLKPTVIVAENVGGINSANGGDTFKQILDDLAQVGNGYRLTVHYYKAEEYGVPQTRHRYIIVGFDQTTPYTFQVPAPTHADNYVTAKQALSNLPDDTPNHIHSRVSKTVVERLKHIKPGQNAWNSNLPEHLRLNVKGAKLSQIYRRLHPDQPSYTVTGSGGGGTHGYHYDEPRPLTNRERARLQSFPDDFVFLGKKEQIRKQIGMAVPPLLSRIIFNAILDTINHVNYSSIEPNYTAHITPQQLSLFD